MSLDIKFSLNIGRVQDEKENSVNRALAICGGMAQGYAVENITRNGSVDTGNLRNSIAFQVESNEVAVGTNCEYAIYVEMGTGKYVAGGSPPWIYPSKNSKGETVFYRTEGQPPKPYLKPALADHIGQYENIIRTELSK